MNIKKIFTKIIASALLITNFTGILCAYAAKPELQLSCLGAKYTGSDLSAAQSILYTKKEEFESLAPGIFYVEPDFLTASSSDIGSTINAIKALEEITDIFKNIQI